MLVPDNEADFDEILNLVDIDAESGSAFVLLSSLEAGLVSAEEVQNVSYSCSRLAC